MWGGQCADKSGCVNYNPTDIPPPGQVLPCGATTGIITYKTEFLIYSLSSNTWVSSLPFFPSLSILSFSFLVFPSLFFSFLLFSSASLFLLPRFSFVHSPFFFKKGFYKYSKQPHRKSLPYSQPFKWRDVRFWRDDFI